MTRSPTFHRLAGWRAIAAATLLCLTAQLSCAADAVDPDRFHALTQELRCVVCQNESLADSNAAIALDLKREIREQMAAGKSDADIRQFLIARYGNFITYRPPADASTLLLWAGPALLAMLAGLLLWRLHRSSQPSQPLVPIDAAPREDTHAQHDT